MKKILLTVCIIAIVMTCNSSKVFAMCPHPNAVNGLHLFSDHQTTGGHYEDLGYHEYQCGVDEYGSPVNAYDCHIMRPYRHCVIVCHHCGTELSGSSHQHEEPVWHSIQHN